MPTLKRRVLFSTAATILAAACGAAVGYLLAWEVTEKATESRLQDYASRILMAREASSDGLRDVLDAMAASTQGFCSAGEIDYFRALIFESEDVKDAGHMRDGRIECSAILNNRAQALDPSAPDFTLTDGTRIYKNLPAYRSSDLTLVALQQGEAFVLYTPLSSLHLEPAPMHLTETVADSTTRQPGRLLGESPATSMATLTKPGVVRRGQDIYATRCSTRYFNCVTAYTSIPEILVENRIKFNLCVALCAVLGTLIGLVFSLLHRRNKSMEQQLRRAVRKDMLRVFYQPIVNLGTRRIVGAEALVRWNDEEGAMVRPDIFVRVAEERGFVGEITRLVIRHVLRDFAAELQVNPEFRLSVNITAADLADASFLPMLQDSLKRAEVEPKSMAIELTESSTARNDVAIKTIRNLRACGHSVHIDDFGTGYSSLSYLSSLSIDAIKIDRSFTQAIGTGSVTVGIVPQILGIAQALNLEVIVEGIESLEQADYFASTDRVLLAQGWLFGRPLPANDFKALLEQSQKPAMAPADAA